MTERRKGVPALVWFLAAVSVLFIGILIWVYVETKRINPKMIETGWAGQEACPTKHAA